MSSYRVFHDSRSMTLAMGRTGFCTGQGQGDHPEQREQYATLRPRNHSIADRVAQLPLPRSGRILRPARRAGPSKSSSNERSNVTSSASLSADMRRSISLLAFLFALLAALLAAPLLAASRRLGTPGERAKVCHKAFHCRVFVGTAGGGEGCMKLGLATRLEPLRRLLPSSLGVCRWGCC